MLRLKMVSQKRFDKILEFVQSLYDSVEIMTRPVEGERKQREIIIYAYHSILYGTVKFEFILA